MITFTCRLVASERARERHPETASVIRFKQTGHYLQIIRIILENRVSITLILEDH